MMKTEHLRAFLGSVAQCIGFVVEHVTHGALEDAAREAEQARQYCLDALDVSGRLA